MIRKMIRINTIWEAKNSLHMRGASHSWEGGSWSSIPVFGSGITPPCDSSDVLVDVGLAFGGCVAGYGVEIGRERDLRFVNVLVVRLEGGGEDLCVIVAVYIVEGRSPWEIVSA